VSRTGWVVSADSAESDAPATNAVDGTASIWHTQWRTANPRPPHTFTVNLGADVALGGFRYLPPQGTNNNGQIATWNFYTSQDGVTWALAAQGAFANTIAEKTVTIVAIANRAPVLAVVPNQTRVIGGSATLALSATDADGDVLSYAATGLPPGLSINAGTGLISGTATTAGTYATTAQVSDGRGGVATRSFTWTVTTATPTVRYVRLEALTEVNGNAWTTMAEFNVFDKAGATLARTGWQVSADSAETDAPATNAVDGTSSIWHTQWRTASPRPPHTFTVNLGADVQVGGFRYLPPQGTNNNGQIANWNFYTSQDGVTWTAVAQGTFANTIAEKTVTVAPP
jgi:hypothetical protein